MRLMQGLILSLFLLVSVPVLAQEAAVYRVADVTVDVTADNAAQARDQAILQAQRQGFDLLLIRLGAAKGNARVSDESLAEMVKAFDLQKEHAASKRYTGTFTIHFKPEKVRAFLSERGTGFSEEQAAPYVVLPVVRTSERDILWEDRTTWRDAWEEASQAAGLVPLIVPPGELDDIALVSAAEALGGKAENLRAVMAVYKAGGVLVAVYDEKEETIEARPYREDGSVLRVAIEIQKEKDSSGKKPLENMKAEAKKTIEALDKAWREASTARREGETASMTPAAPTVAWSEAARSAPSTNISTQPSFLSVSAPVPTLAAWAQIRNALAQAPSVVSTHVITMTRGLVRFELQFQGDIETLRQTLEERGLLLDQGADGGWVVQRHGGLEDM